MFPVRNAAGQITGHPNHQADVEAGYIVWPTVGEVIAALPVCSI